MDKNLLRRLSEKLRNRASRLPTFSERFFHYALVRLWKFLNAEEMIRSVMVELEPKCPDASKLAEQIIGSGPHHPTSEIEQVAIAYFIIKHCVESENSNIEYKIIVDRYGSAVQVSKDLEQFRMMFVQPLVDYIDEQLDDQRAVLGLLRRYKHHCEWFRRDDLLNIVVEEKERSSESGKKSRAEKRLALHLYEYLHSHGLSFSIEPASISGEADLIAAQNSDDPLIADVKVFDPPSGKNKSYLISGFHQVYQYTGDHNEPFGYLVIFKICQDILSITSGQQEQSTPFVTINGKSIFFVVIDLFAHEKSASKRGKLKRHDLPEQDLVAHVMNSEEPQSASNTEDGEIGDLEEVS